MTVEEEIRSYSAEIEELRKQLGILSITAYVQPGSNGPEPLFVADLDVTRLEGYSKRFFGLMFGLQRLFARVVEVLETEIFEREVDKTKVSQVSMDVFRATA